MDEKIAYWQGQQRDAFRMIRDARELGTYYDDGYFRAWFERHALCYRRIEALRAS